LVKYLSRFALFFLLVCGAQLTVAETAFVTKPKVPDLLLAHVYQRGLHVPDYLVSEKYDGVRALWDGQQLVTRAGNVIHAPTWFTQGFPKQALDGELWLARGKFDVLSGIVRKDVPIDREWRAVSYMVFELPQAQGTFEVRAQRIEQLIKQANLPHLQAVKQTRLSDDKALQMKLNQVVQQGGEGLMLHRADAVYVTGRSDVLLKLKPYLDAEAMVVGHTAGRGKYQGKLGALIVDTKDGVRFKLGTGFTDVQRENPPKIGSVVTYAYTDVTKNGKPKFARFLRARHP
jgi:DNA ligase 1